MQFNMGKVSRGIIVFPDDKGGWHFAAKADGKSITNSKEYIRKTPEEAFELAMIWWEQEVTSEIKP